MKNVLYNTATIITIITVLIFITITSGCAVTQPPRFYILSPIKDTSLQANTFTGEQNIIGVGPVKFPKYLSRSQIVRFTGENEMVVEEFDRWAEPLDNNFTRVLRTNLTRLLVSSYAIDYPWKRSLNVRFQVMLDIHQFETGTDGTINFNAHWAIFNLSKNKKIEVVRNFNYTNKIKEINYSNIVAEQSKGLAMLSQEIAKELHRLLDL